MAGLPGAAAWRGGNPRLCRLPGAAFGRKAIPRSPLSPPLTRGPDWGIFYARRKSGCADCGGKVRGRIWNPPLQTGADVAGGRDGRGHPGDRRAGCPHPAGPRGGGNIPVLNRCGAAAPRERHFAGRQSPAVQAPGGNIWPEGNPPISALAPFDKGAWLGRILCPVLNRGVPVAARGAGGINPSPTNCLYARCRPGGRAL